MSKADQKVPFVFPSTPTVELASEGTIGMEHFQLTKSHIDGRNKRAWGILESQQLHSPKQQCSGRLHLTKYCGLRKCVVVF